MRLIKYVLALLSVGILLFLLLIGYGLIRPLQVIEYDMYLKVSDHVGINVNNSAFYFGKTTPGNGATRYFTVSNSYPFNIKVKMSASGELGQITGFSKNNFVLKPGEAEELEIYVTVPDDWEQRDDYTGKFRARFFKPYIWD